jgi:hypothetical protein
MAVAKQGHEALPGDRCQVIDQLGWVEYLTPLRRQVRDVLDRLSGCVCWHRCEHHPSRRAQARDVTLSPVH